LRGRFRAVWASPPAVFPSVAHSVFFCLPRICGATRPSLPVICFYFSISFSDLFHFSSPPPSGGGFRASSPIYVFFYSLALLAHFQYDVLYGWMPHNSSFGFSDMPRLALGVFASLDRF
jgi:hypothetical protein